MSSQWWALPHFFILNTFSFFQHFSHMPEPLWFLLLPVYFRNQPKIWGMSVCFLRGLFFIQFPEFRFASVVLRHPQLLRLLWKNKSSDFCLHSSQAVWPNCTAPSGKKMCKYVSQYGASFRSFAQFGHSPGPSHSWCLHFAHGFVTGWKLTQ